MKVDHLVQQPFSCVPFDGEIMAKKKKMMYVCQNCGYDNTRWMGKCPSCGAWNTMAEEIVVPPAEERRGVASAGEPPQPIAEIRAEDLPRFSTGSGELDRVLGGGVIPGSIVLIVGDPGVGKSSLPCAPRRILRGKDDVFSM